MALTFKLEKDETQWHAFCPDLPGCHTFGANQEEALKNLKNAVMLYLEDEIDNQAMQAVLEFNESEKTHA